MSDVTVFVELVRPSDGRTSEPVKFTYVVDKVLAQRKKRKANSSYSSFDSFSGGSIGSLSDIPIPVAAMQTEPMEAKVITPDNNFEGSPMSPIETADLASALYESASPDHPLMSYATCDQMWSRLDVPQPPVINVTSSELDNLARNPLEQEKLSAAFEIYLKSHNSSLDEVLNAPRSEVPNGISWNAQNNVPKQEYPKFQMAVQDTEDTTYPTEYHQMSFINSVNLVTDSGRAKGVESKPPSSHSTTAHGASSNARADIPKLKQEYSACYKFEDGVEVKKLVKELCDIMRAKTGIKKQMVRSKLEKICEMRLSNGDTFLHMSLCNNQAKSMEYMVKLIHNMKMTHILNLTNDDSQTILHLAIIYDMPTLVSFLVSKGCDPMVTDKDGHNAIHIAVICETCLEPLLDAIKRHNVPCDLNSANNEGLTALQLCVIRGVVSGARALLSAGARPEVRDALCRTALHRAALDHHAQLVRELLQFVPQEEVDALDGQGLTALQLVCDSSEPSSNTLEIVEMLLEHKADPFKHDFNNKPAWKLASDKPEIREIMLKYVSSTDELVTEEYIKSEPEDDFESADEFESGLSDLSIYLDELSIELDKTGGWRQLAERLGQKSLLNWYENLPTPTKAMFKQVKECNTEDVLTSKKLILMLEDLGQKQAANIIRKCIDV